MAAAVSHIVGRTRELGVLYAHDGWAPLSDVTLGILLERAGIRWRYRPLEGLGEIVWPPVCGRYVMHVESTQTPGEKRLALRHGLAHVLAGHVDERNRAWCAEQEAVADAFSLLDLVPDRMIREWQRAGFSAPELEIRVLSEVRRYAASWPSERVHDRVRRRMAMFSQLAHGGA